MLRVDGQEHRVDYEPAESSTGLFGGNSNWRGPIWFPVNYLMIESLQKFHHYFGDDFKVECPTGSGTMLTLWEVAEELSHRLSQIFLRDDRRPAAGLRIVSDVPERSALARPHPVPRVLPRRRRLGGGREPPDRLDRPRRQAAAAERRARAATGHERADDRLSLQRTDHLDEPQVDPLIALAPVAVSSTSKESVLDLRHPAGNASFRAARRRVGPSRR